ncbi:MAG: hypothetical protein IAE78_32795 [Myxococcus sp.]|nr:hypothetical protein [Myxococcus sp.]
MCRLAPLTVLASLLACGAPQVLTHDVSFLVPLSQSQSFLSAATVLPRWQFDRLHPLTVVDEPDALYGALSVVSVRLDACFREGATPGPCRPQVRLVLQPVFDDGPGGLTTRDAAVHLFFSTTEGELETLVRGLAALRTERRVAAGDATAPHPGFSDAAFVKALRERLTPFLQPPALVRITSMSVHASNLAWVFSGADVVNGVTTDLDIPTLGAEHHDHVTSTGKDQAMEVTLDPGSRVEPALTTLVAPGGLARATPEALSAAALAVQRLEDPATHNPGTVDCASCHVAALAQRALVKAGQAVEGSPGASGAYDDTRNLRAFGYFFATPAVSPRVQRETALVRDDFARRLETK